MHYPEKKILAIIQLKGFISSHQSLSVDRPIFKELEALLDTMLRDITKTLPEKSYSDLVDEIKPFAPRYFDTLTSEIQTEKRLAQLMQLRKSALECEEDLFLGELFEGLSFVSLKPFSWNDTSLAFMKIMDQMKSGTLTFEEMAIRFSNYFQLSHIISMPAGFCKLSRGVIDQFIKEKLISTVNTHGVIDDVNRIIHAASQNREKIAEAFFTGEIHAEKINELKNDGYLFLKNYWYSERLQKQIRIDTYLMYWNGPSKVDFLDKWWIKEKTNEKAELIISITGIHPKREALQWQAYAENRIRAENSDYQAFVEIIRANQIYYDFGFILGCRALSGDGFDEIWKPVFESFNSSHFATGYPKLKKTIDAKRTGASHPLSEEPDFPFELEDETMGDALIQSEMDADIESLSATHHHLSREDTIVESKSTWNKYFKPFLSENILGVLGAGLLMLAWLCISIWVWNKGPYYKLLTGALPMFMTTLSLSFMARFFYNHLDKGVSPKAPVLFSSLCILSIPFNYLIALTMLLSGSMTGIIIGSGMTLIYCGGVFFISSMNQHIVSFPFGPHLSIINGFMLLSSVFLFIVKTLPRGITDGVLFFTLFSLAHMLYGQRDNKDSSERFRLFLFGGNFILINVVFSIYLYQFPSIQTISLFCQFTAIILVFSKDSFSVISRAILSSAISLTGLIISLYSGAVFVLLSLLFAIFLWTELRKNIDGRWPDEIIVSLILLAAPALLFSFYAPIFTIGLFLIPCGGAAVLFEKKVSQHPTKVVSYGIPIMILTLFYLTHHHTSYAVIRIITANVAMFIFGVYGYIRYTQYYLKRLWIDNIFLMLFFPFLCMIKYAGPSVSLFVLLLSTGLWAMVSRRLKDALTYQFKTSILWISSLVSVLMFGYIAIEIRVFTIWFPLNYLLLLPVLFYGAKRSKSEIPIYAALITSALFFISLFEMFQLHMKFGTGAATTALSLLFLVNILDRTSLFSEDEVNEVFFKWPFELQHNRFLTRPMENAAYLLTALATFRATLNFSWIYYNQELSMNGVKVCLTFALSTSIIFQYIKKYAKKNSGFLLLVPSTLLYINMCSFIPTTALPIVLIVSVFILSFFTHRIDVTETYMEEMKDTLNDLILWTAYLSIPTGFLIYTFGGLFHSHPNPFMLLLSVVMICLFNHFFVIQKIHKNLTHITLSHITIFSLFIFSYFFPGTFQLSVLSLSRSGASFSVFILLLSLIYFFPGYIFEVSENHMKREYGKAFHIWLCVASLLFSLLIFMDFYEGGHHLSIGYVIAAVFLMHAGNRYFNLFFPIPLKGFFCAMIGTILSKNPLWGMIIGMMLFSLFEFLIITIDGKAPLRVQSVLPSDKNPLWRMAWTYHGFIILFLLIHLFSFYLFNENPPHYLIYLTIPFAVFMYRYINLWYTGYIAVGLFAYATSFLSLNFFEIFKANGLNHLHLLGTAITISIFSFRGYDLIKQRLERGMK